MSYSSHIVSNIIMVSNVLAYSFQRFQCPGFPHNPYNGVVCNDVIAASGVFTAKELWKFTKGYYYYRNCYWKCILFMSC